jgi:hypothetical protein
MNSNKYSYRFLRAVDFVLKHEAVFARGHYGDWNFVVSENVSADKGGVTKYGIDERSHPKVDVENLTKDEAVEIYHKEYWIPSHAEDFPTGVGELLFDIKVNGGNGIQMLQDALCKLDIHCMPDGIFGPNTIAACKLAGTPVIKALCERREQRYRAIAAADSTQKKFLEGWLNRNKDAEQFATT